MSRDHMVLRPVGLRRASCAAGKVHPCDVVQLAQPGARQIGVCRHCVRNHLPHRESSTEICNTPAAQLSRPYFLSLDPNPPNCSEFWPTLVDVGRFGQTLVNIGPTSVELGLGPSFVEFYRVWANSWPEWSEHGRIGGKLRQILVMFVQIWATLPNTWRELAKVGKKRPKIGALGHNFAPTLGVGSLF